VIICEHLTKRYRGRPAVDDLSFTVRPGAVTAFLGPNGAGKSTTMRLLLGLDRGEGRTTFGGRRLAELTEPAREVGAVLDARAFHPGRTARNHLRMLADGAGIGSGRVDEVLALVGLDGDGGRRAGGFSLGMGQRLSLAAALLGDPGTLLLDEPANGLDPAGVRWLHSLLAGFAAEGRTVLVSTHQLAGLEPMVDDVVVIAGGRLVRSCPAAEFAAGTTLEAAFLAATAQVPA
jgi:ABC-2 type transport system ATP-binding protein